MADKISIIVPVYNVEKYLRQCLDSIVGQTYQNIEVILVDDGSPDGCGMICEEYAKRDSRITVIHQANRGTAAARNLGLERAAGEWIAYVDADDWLPENALADLTACADGNDIVIGEYYYVSNGKAMQSSFFRQDIPDEKKQSPLWLIGNALGCPAYGLGGRANIGVPWARLFRKAFLAGNGVTSPVGLRRMQDTVLNIRAFLCAPRIGYCPQPVYCYRVWDQSVCRAYDPHFADTAAHLLACLREPVGSNADPKIRELYGFKQVSLLLETGSLYYCHKDCPLTLREKRQGLKALCEDPGNAAILKGYNKSLFGMKKRVLLWMLEHRLYLSAYGLKKLRARLHG